MNYNINLHEYHNTLNYRDFVMEFEGLHETVLQNNNLFTPSSFLNHDVLFF